MFSWNTEVNGVNKIPIAAQLVLLFSVLTTMSCLAQAPSFPQWVKGYGSAVGTDMAVTRTVAINRAEADALRQAGIELRATEFRRKTESGDEVTDFYSQFAESSTRGLILEERNVFVHRPVSIGDGLDEYRIDVELEANIVVQNGEPDPGFHVQLESDRESYDENEPVHLMITSSRSGYLVLFHIANDSLALLLPNAVTRQNYIRADTTFIFPPNENYSLAMWVNPGRKASDETFVAVVTLENIPFAKPDRMMITGRQLDLRQDLRTSYAKWLHKIPADRRTSDWKVLQVTKKPD